MSIWIALSAVAAFVLVASLLTASIYNRLIVLGTACENGFSQIEVQLKRRYDLIPNLVECVRSYLSHERETLEAVIAARNQAVAGMADAKRHPSDAAAVEKWVGAEGALAGALGRLTLVMETYPELKGKAAVAELTEELTSTENRIAFARQAYNDWVTAFNSRRQTLPTCLFAGAMGFGENRRLLEFSTAEPVGAAPKVTLGSASTKRAPAPAEEEVTAV